MALFKVKYNECFKDECFTGLSFPFIVKGEIIKHGTMKGWLVVSGKDLIDLGCTGWLVENYMNFEFSPAAFEKV
jgi:hypothetical protein